MTTTFVEKLAALANRGPVDLDKPLVVRRRWNLFGLFPLTRFDSHLWIADDGDWWRVMLSKGDGLIIGADFRKSNETTLVEDDFIAWKRVDNEWKPARQMDAVEIRELIEISVLESHDQYCQSRV